MSAYRVVAFYVIPAAIAVGTVTLWPQFTPHVLAGFTCFLVGFFSADLMRPKT